jgi:hypothetical protein
MGEPAGWLVMTNTLPWLKYVKITMLLSSVNHLFNHLFFTMGHGKTMAKCECHNQMVLHVDWLPLDFPCIHLMEKERRVEI